MRSKFAGLTVAFKRGRIVWTGDWWPHPLSDTYLIQVSYALGRRPRIAILRPQLQLAEGKTHLPHVYLDGQMDICVHRPEEWTPSSFIADTIMPWVSQWLRFYEVWQQTGSWEGEGAHPEAESHQRSDV
ncbi:MAG: hypothetical protein LAP21_18930 [Acidobacteriia bacterium]|nr:hypothetical protein [Terriglobia bacterium]